ncbi:hypothetical protein FSP39_019277 [Pinctada imbricata]|uniref:Sulfotransferase domain-containing protein n=1 Tax=Pinctada imbricata TaxID=66713 RepID=A0AA89BMT4_PINIB|nr:hypothetical protein FSP39_019277 [Pinctada imbricata]
MAVVKYFREGRIFRKDGEIEFDILTVDGIGLAPYPLPGGYPKRINDIINMDTRPDDIILATFPKCGTHWMREILEMLVRGQAEYSKEKLVIPLELAANMNMINSLPSPRVLHTHLPYKWFPRKHIENGGKIIHGIRNPKDTYVSYFHHSSTGLEFGQKTKGMTWEQFFDNCVIGKVDYIFPACLCGTWFDNAKEMDLAKRNNTNIYTVHYEKLKEDQSREIKAIATFLGISVTDDLVKDITEKCVFKNLKYAYEEIKEYPQELKKLIKEHHEAVKDFKHPNIFRKAKRIVQEFCRLKIGWDDAIPQTQERAWKEWMSNLPEIENISTDRCCKPASLDKICNAQLHIFSDGSESRHGACAYLRLVDKDDNVSLSLVMGKSRLAPIKQSPILRLENKGGYLQQQQVVTPTAKPQNTQCKNTKQTSTKRRVRDKERHNTETSNTKDYT